MVLAAAEIEPALRTACSKSIKGLRKGEVASGRDAGLALGLQLYERSMCRTAIVCPKPIEPDHAQDRHPYANEFITDIP